MRVLLRWIILLGVVLLVPVLPLLILGLSFEERITQWLPRNPPAAVSFSLIVGLLATDVFLPIPSSMVTTYAGGVLGVFPATLASWLGMSIGAVLGFWLARVFGRSFVVRRSGRRDLGQAALLSQKFGPLALVLTRALPILAEACVLLMGATRLSWRRFLIPVLTSNLVISLTYAAFGKFFKERDAFPAAVVFSGTVPLLLALVARRWLPEFARRRTDHLSPTETHPAERS